MDKIKVDQSFYTTFNTSFVDQYVAALDCSDNRYAFQNSIDNFDHQLYDYYAPQNYRSNKVSRELYEQPNSKIIKLEIPKNQSLTDSMLRSTLGCEEKFAKSYLQIIDQTDKHQEIQKKKRVELAKKKFAQSNSHKDFCANSKPFMNNIRFALQRPVIDNEHESYLKTQLIFLQQPKGTTSNTKEYFDKHTELIAKKINELGGMEDTIGRMEDSLQRNEVKSFKKKQTLANMNQERKSMFSPAKGPHGDGKLKQSWINRSKEMRQSFMSRFQIE